MLRPLPASEPFPGIAASQVDDLEPLDRFEGGIADGIEAHGVLRMPQGQQRLQ